MNYQINIDAVRAADKVSALDPNYESVKNIVVLRAVVSDGTNVLELYGNATEEGKEADTIHSLLCKTADAIREKTGISPIIRA